MSDTAKVSGIADRIVARAGEIGVAHAVHGFIDGYGRPAEDPKILDAGIAEAERRLGISAVATTAKPWDCLCRIGKAE